MSQTPFEHRVIEDLRQPDGMQKVFKELDGLRKQESQQAFQEDLAHLNKSLHSHGLLPECELIEERASGFKVNKNTCQQTTDTGTQNSNGPPDLLHDPYHRFDRFPHFLPYPTDRK
jgi:hypothetical protein